MAIGKRIAKEESGQAMVEYIILVAVIAGLYLVLVEGLTRGRVAERLLKPLHEDFAFAYKYGHPQARGFDEGKPKRHPRISAGEDNFRIFINPSVR